MTKEEIIRLAKFIISEEVERAGFKVEEIILFGSRARGEEKIDSDWDFYVVVDKEIDFKTKKKLIGNIQMRLAEYYIFCDLLVNDIKTHRKLSKEKSSISYVTSIEGFLI